ncbi:hypothetical protein [Phaeobacter sp. C3_T13_0]|uniref:hypothetical protein n=1 Tax=Phaeobacter cretensis TaxID=3342641 RepID=UPI0039BD9125
MSAAHLFLGLGSAAGFGPLIADISHWFQRRRGIAVALVASGNYLSGAMWSTALAGMLADSCWRSVYATLAVVTLLVVITLSVVLRRRISLSAQSSSAAMSAGDAARVGLTPRQLQWILGLDGIGSCVAMSMPQVHIVAYYVGLDL